MSEANARRVRVEWGYPAPHQTTSRDEFLSLREKMARRIRSAPAGPPLALRARPLPGGEDFWRNLFGKTWLGQHALSDWERD
jgi:hypothetical protein